MKTFRLLGLLFVAFGLVQCAASRQGKGDDGKIEITILHLNDVYEISPSSASGEGGMARVAALRKELLAKNPNTLTVLAGDFISPSVIGTLKYEGKRIRGKQMVETMNAVGVDYVVFGNHEFDYDLEDLQARMNESAFTWIGGNARMKNADGSLTRFSKMRNNTPEESPDHVKLTFQDADGTTVNVGMLGVLINTGRKPWVTYTDWTAAAKQSYEQLKGETDFVLGLTHLNVADDKKLMEAIPQLPLVMGGHDHENMFFRINGNVLAKADANATSAYVHTIVYDKKSKRASVRSQLRRIDNTLGEEPNTAAVVAKWEKIKNESLATSGFDPNKKVTDLTTPLDCREASIRYQQAPVGRMIGQAMLAASKNKPVCALLNGGSIRVDDILRGTLYEIDIVRMLPFGGGIAEVEMKGSLLRKTLETGLGNAGSGGYLQWTNIAYDAAGKNWTIAGNTLEDAKTYRVVLPEFLLTGNEQKMEFLRTSINADGTTTNPDIPKGWKANPSDKTDLRNDIRLAVIADLSK